MPGPPWISNRSQILCGANPRDLAHANGAVLKTVPDHRESGMPGKRAALIHTPPGFLPSCGIDQANGHTKSIMKFLAEEKGRCAETRNGGRCASTPGGVARRLRYGGKRPAHRTEPEVRICRVADFRRGAENCIWQEATPSEAFPCRLTRAEPHVPDKNIGNGRLRCRRV